jgi:hypothetical protein
MNHDLGQLYNVPHRAFPSSLPAAYSLDLAVDLAQGKTGPASRHGSLPFAQPLTDAGARRCLKPAHCAPKLYDSAYHAMDLADRLVIGSIEPVHAVNLFRHA